MGVAGGSCRVIVLASWDCDESFDKILRVYTSARIEMNVAVFLIFTSQVLRSIGSQRRYQVASKEFKKWKIIYIVKSYSDIDRLLKKYNF